MTVGVLAFTSLS